MNLHAQRLISGLVSLVLCSQLAAPHAWAQNTGANNLEALAPSSEVQSFVENLERGQTTNLSLRALDVFGLADQSIEIYNKDQKVTYDLNQMQLDIPITPFTAARIKYDAGQKMLVIEALRGVDASSPKVDTDGVVVARHFIRNLSLQSFAQDKELFQMIDADGKMHVLDKGLIPTQAFRAPLPVIKNVWESKRKFNEIKVGFLTRGSEVPHITEQSIVPKDAAGKMHLSAGDFYIYEKNLYGITELVGVFSRDMTYQSMIRGYKVVAAQAMLLSPDPETLMKVEKAIAILDGSLENMEQRQSEAKTSPQVDAILSSLSTVYTGNLVSRAAGVGALQARQRDQFELSEWERDLAELLKNNPTAKPDEIEKNWSQMLKPQQANPENLAQYSLRDQMKEQRQQMSRGRGLVYLAGVTGIGAAAYFGSRYNIDLQTVQEQLKVVQWAYDKFYPAVLKDANYKWPLIYSMTALAAIWPVAVAHSALIGLAFKQLAKKYEGQLTKKAVYIKDLANNWSPLNNWQRITSFGMRLYAWLILPYWTVAIEHVLQQKSFSPAVNNALNPFGRISADSDLGRKLGLTKTEWYGLSSVANSVFNLSKDLVTRPNEIARSTENYYVDPRQEKQRMNQQIQSHLVSQNKQVNGTALLIATTLLAEKYQADPSTVMQLIEGQFKPQEALKFLDTEEKKKEWVLLTDLIIRDMKNLKNSSIDINEELRANIDKYYKSGKEVLEKLDQSSELKRRLLTFRRTFSKTASQTLVAFMNFAKADHEFLKKVYTNEFVSDQVKKEFTIDHMMVVAVIGLYGERADLSHPEHLAADAKGFLWTSRAHWYDMFTNTFSHFFVAGAQTALVFQKAKAQQANNYDPKADAIYHSKDRTQGFVAATFDWTKEVIFMPWKADLGGIMTKRFFKRFTTITAGLTLMAILRVGIWDQPVDIAIRAWVFNFFAAQWFFGWVWDPVQRGNQMEGERIEEMNEKLKIARRELFKGDENKGREIIKALYAQNNSRVLKLYDLDNMDKSALVEMTVLNPPVYTKANALLSWVTTWGAAIGSTVLAIPLSVILMDEKLISDPRIFYGWIGASMALYAGSYALLGKKPWEFYIAKWNQLAEKYEKPISKAQGFVGRITAPYDRTKAWLNAPLLPKVGNSVSCRSILN